MCEVNTLTVRLNVEKEQCGEENFNSLVLVH